MRRRCEMLRDKLGQVMGRPPGPKTIIRWTAEQREHAEEWAERELLHASDHVGVRRIQPPSCINVENIYARPIAHAIHEPAPAVEGDL